MADFKITRFGGLLPRIHRQDLPVAMAQECVDVDLSRGVLRPFRTDKLVSEQGGKSLWTDGCCVITSGNCRTSFAHVYADCDWLVATELDDFGYPVVATREKACAGKWCRLGFPVDLPAPVAVNQGVVREDFNRELRQYVYTLVNEWGWESFPSDVSDVLVADNDVDVVVSGIPAAFDGWCVELVRVYCAVSGLDYGSSEQKEAEFLLVGEFDLGQTSFRHVAHSDYGDLLVSDEYAPPSDEMVSVCYAGNGQLGGIVGNELWLSEPLLPHAWNEKYRYGNFRGVPVRFLAGESVGYVLTTGFPAVVEMGSVPSEMGCRDISVIEESLPIISFQSAALYGGGCVYGSRDGLVFLSGTQARVFSLDFWTVEQWQLMKPWTLRGVVHDGWYFGCTDTVCFRLKVPDAIYEKVEVETLGHLSLSAAGWYRSDADVLFFVNESGVFEWNAGDDWKSFIWRSRLNVSGGYTAWAAYKIGLDFAPVSVRHIGQKRYTGALVGGDVVLGDKVVEDSRPHRLKVGYSGLMVDVEIRGKGEVFEYHVATSVSELGGR